MYKGIPRNSLYWWHYKRENGPTTHVTISNQERTQYSLYAIDNGLATLVSKSKTPENHNEIVEKAWGKGRAVVSA